MKEDEDDEDWEDEEEFDIFFDGDIVVMVIVDDFWFNVFKYFCKWFLLIELVVNRMQNINN